MAFIVKNTTFPNPLDLIAPHSCRGCDQLGSPLCEKCKNYIISHRQNYCPLCKKPKFEPIADSDSPFATLDLPTELLCPNCPQLPHAFTIDSRNNLIGQLIHDFKYRSVRALASPLADLLHQTLPKLTGPVIVVPLPTISRHVRERGLDHIYLIAKHFVKLRGDNYQIQRLLVRDQNTVQVGADKASRAIQAQKAYKLASDAKISAEATYILLDDVWTTGASMQAAYQTLIAANTHNAALDTKLVDGESSATKKPQTDASNPKIILATLAVSIDDTK